jgi:hypothetical protein
MSRAKAKFVEADIRRVLVAARKANVNVAVEIATDGKIVVVTRPSEKKDEVGDDLDKWIKQHDASATEGH